MEKYRLPNSTGVLILGILSVVTCCCYGIIGLPLGIVALVMASKATKLYLETPENYTGFSNVKTGKVFTIIGIVLNCIFLMYVIWILSIIGFSALQDPSLLQERIQEFGI
jgi:hypothetical protein